jgi:ABC-2 type transport system ATP-binding protein
MIEIKNLIKNYGEIQAVRDISFTVESGEILGFLGPNGAGKSTTLNILTGFLSATSGTVRIGGIDILNDPQAAKRQIGYLPETPPLYLDMTVSEYLQFVCELKGVAKGDRIRQLAEIMRLVRISDVSGRLIKNLSKGYRQRVGIAQALVGNPDVLILDEPTVGLDPKQIIEIRNLIQELGKQHTVILSSNILPEVKAVCDRVVIISQGQIVAVDTPDGLSRKLAKTSRLSMTAQGPAKEIIPRLRQLAGVKRVDALLEKDDGLIVLELETDPEVDARKPIFFEMARGGWPIYELKSLDPTLEEIFLQLTGPAAAGNRR